MPTLREGGHAALTLPCFCIPIIDVQPRVGPAPRESAPAAPESVCEPPPLLIFFGYRKMRQAGKGPTAEKNCTGERYSCPRGGSPFDKDIFRQQNDGYMHPISVILQSSGRNEDTLPARRDGKCDRPQDEGDGATGTPPP